MKIEEKASFAKGLPIDAEEVSIALTVITSETGRLTKQFSLGSDGQPVAGEAPKLVRAKANRQRYHGTAVQILEQVGGMLDTLSSSQALTCAPPPPGKDEWLLLTVEEVGDRKDVIARSEKHLRPTDGAALFVLDHDAKRMSADVWSRVRDQGGLANVLKSVCPAVGSAAYFTRRSSSSSVAVESAGLNAVGPPDSAHRYLVIRNGLDATSFAKRLHQRLVLGAFGWAEVTKTGSISIKSPVDPVASAPHWLTYEADPILGEGLTLKGKRNRPVTPGGLLDTEALPELTEAELVQLASIEDALKADKKDEAEEARERYREARAVQLATKGLSPERIAKVLDGALERHELSGEWEIYLDTGEIVTAAEILSDPDAFHLSTCGDPHEPEYGRGKAKIFVNEHSIIINSFAHGGARYRLVLDPSDWFQPVAPDQDDPVLSPAADDGPADIWSDGDDGALGDLPPGVLPTILEDWSADVAARVGVYRPMVWGSGLAVLASAIGSSVAIQPKLHDNAWTEDAGLWVALVEEPGGKKSPVIAEAMRPLRKLEAQHAREDNAKLEEWGRLTRNGKKPEAGGPRPIRRRYTADNFTMEALTGILMDNPRGVMVAQDELTQLLGSLNSYKGGGGSDRQVLLRLYDGGPQTVDRVGSGSRYVPNWSARVLGGIQPKKMKELASSLDADGLLQRFIPIVGPGKQPEGEDRPVNLGAVREYTRAVQRLATARYVPERPVVRLSPEASEIRNEFRREVECLRSLTKMSDGWKGHLGKWDGIFARILLVCHMLEGLGIDLRPEDVVEMPVSGETAARVAKLCRYLLRHAAQFYQSCVGMGETAEAAEWIAGHLLTRPDLTEVSARGLGQAKKDFRPGRGGEQQIRDAMTLLEAYGWVTPTDAKNGRRDASPRWTIDPRIHIRFVDRAKAETKRRARERAAISAAAEQRRRLKV